MSYRVTLQGLWAAPEVTKGYGTLTMTRNYTWNYTCTPGRVGSGRRVGLFVACGVASMPVATGAGTEAGRGHGRPEVGRGPRPGATRGRRVPRRRVVRGRGRAPARLPRQRTTALAGCAGGHGASAQ